MEIKGAFVKKFEHSIGKGESTLTVVLPLSMETATRLLVERELFRSDGEPWPRLIKTELDVDLPLPYLLTLDVEGLQEPLMIGCSSATQWVAERTEKPINGHRFIITFKAGFTGSALNVLSWLQRYGSVSGTLSLVEFGPQQQELMKQFVEHANAQTTAGVN